MILFRYLFKELLFSTLVVSLVLFVIVVFTRLNRYLELVVSGSLETYSLVWVILYNSPSFFQLILPFAFIISIMIVLGKMYSDNEMTIIIASGFSERKVYEWVIYISFIIITLVCFLTFYVVPDFNHKSRQLRKSNSTFNSLTNLKAGVFQEFSDGLYFIYAKEISSDKKFIIDIFISQTPQNDSDSNTFLIAKKGYQNDDSNGNKYLVLEDGYRYDIFSNKKEIKEIKYKEYGLLLEGENNFMNSLVLNIDEVPTLSLIGKSNVVEKVEFIYRLSIPFLTLILTLLSLPLSKVSPRKGKFSRIFPIILFYLFYLMFLISIKNSIAKGAISLNSIYYLHFIFIVLTLIVYNYDLIKSLFRRK